MNQFIRRLVLANLAVSIVLAKLVRLYINAHSFSYGTLVFCLPAFFIPDALLLAGSWALLQHKRGRFSILSTAAACFLAYVYSIMAVSCPLSLSFIYLLLLLLLFGFILTAPQLHFVLCCRIPH